MQIIFTLMRYANFRAMLSSWKKCYLFKNIIFDYLIDNWVYNRKLNTYKTIYMQLNDWQPN